MGFETVAREAKARYVLGLSAMLARKDGGHLRGMRFLLRGGLGALQLRAVRKSLAAIPDTAILVVTGRYLAGSFDDARLVTLFLAMPIS